MQRAGGRGRLEELHRTKAQLAQEGVCCVVLYLVADCVSAARMIGEATSALDEEARLQSGAQTPSQVLTLSMRQELARLRAALDAGSASDALVQKKLDELLPVLPSLDPAHLASALPAPAPGVAGAGGGFGELREVLAQIDALLREVRRNLLLCLLLFELVFCFSATRLRKDCGRAAGPRARRRWPAL